LFFGKGPKFWRQADIDTLFLGNRVLPLVAKHAKINHASLLKILVLVAQDGAAALEKLSHDALEKLGHEVGSVSDEKLQALVAALFHKKGKLLLEIIAIADQILWEKKVTVTAARQIDTLLGLYQVFKHCAKVDKRAIESAVSAAIYDAITGRDRSTRKTILPGHLK